MDDATIGALVNLAAVALPFVAAGVVWLQKRLSSMRKDLGISNEQGDLMIAVAAALYAPIKAKYTDGEGGALLDRAESIIAEMVATWEDPDGTTEMLERQLAELRAVLAGL